MYGFPESHAASFALIAYASAYLKVYYLAAFTCALLNNQPMGFYAPAVLIKDAQRHGLKVRPMCIQRSEPLCTIEHEPDGSLSVRIGLNYAKGLRQSTAEALTSQSHCTTAPSRSIEDLALRVPATQQKRSRHARANRRIEFNLVKLHIAATHSGRLNKSAGPSVPSYVPRPLR